MSCGAYQDRDGPVWKLREFECARRQASDALFAALALQNPAQHFMLFAVERCTDGGGAPMQSDIARHLHLSPATVTASLRTLEKHGFIRRRADESDQRVNRVEITEEGRRMAERCRSRMDALEAAMFVGFSPEELDMLSGYFERMRRNLDGVARTSREENEA